VLLSSSSPIVADILAEEIARLDKGDAHDEVKWTEIALHACKILSATRSVVFASSDELSNAASAVEHARADGNRVVVLPENIRHRLSGETDSTGAPVRSLDVFLGEWFDSFSFDFVAESDFSRSEAAIFAQRHAIARLVGGLPTIVREVLVSETMRPDSTGRQDFAGLWEGGSKRIIIRREQLRSMESFSATLIHEITHARSGYDDVTREFESALTEAIGMVASKALARRSMEGSAPKGPKEGSAPKGPKPPAIKRRGTSGRAKVARRPSRKR
jgi:hypothetical protein